MIGHQIVAEYHVGMPSSCMKFEVFYHEVLVLCHEHPISSSLEPWVVVRSSERQCLPPPS